MASLVVDPLTEFFDAIRSPLTKDRYEKRLDLFLRHLKIGGSTLKERAASFAVKASRDPQWATTVINEYMRYQKERAERHEIEESTVPNFYKPIKLFCDMNDIVLNWKKITKRIPRGRQFGNDRAPDLSEVRAILSYPDRRVKPMVLTAISAGLRVGSWDYLRWGDIDPIERGGKVQAARIKVYAGTREEYPGFISPEAYQAVLEYMDYRRSCGEKIGPRSQVMRDLFIPDRGGRGEPHQSVALKSSGVKRMVEDALKGTGLWKPLEAGKRRHEFQANHGFRKFFKSVCEKHMKTLHVEILMGHDVGLAENYYRPSQDELLSDYVKAVPDLTITEEWKAKFEASEEIREHEESTRDLIGSLTTQNHQLNEQLKVLAERVTKAESLQSKVQQKQKETDDIMNKLFEDSKFKAAVQEALRRQSK